MLPMFHIQRQSGAGSRREGTTIPHRFRKRPTKSSLRPQRVQFFPFIFYSIQFKLKKLQNLKKKKNEIKLLKKLKKNFKIFEKKIAQIFKLLNLKNEI